MLNGVMVDDDNPELYAKILSVRGVLTFEPMAVRPLTDLAEEIRGKSPRVVALDYGLDDNIGGDNQVTANQTFKAGALAQHFRDHSSSSPDSDFPIILVSSVDKIKHLFAPDKTAHDLFDRVYSKEDCKNDREGITREVVSLVRAYEVFRDCHGKCSLESLFNGSQDDADFINYQELHLDVAQAQAPHLAAQYFLRKVIDRAGILLPLPEVAARLGIDRESVSNLLHALAGSEIGYRGVFSDGWDRWWAHRLDAWADHITGTKIRMLSASERCSALANALEIELSPARSTWDGSSDFHPSFACASCGEPSDIRHSLAAFDPHAPRFSQRKRICWACIQTDRYLDPSHNLIVDAVDADLVSTIQKHDRKA